MSNNPIRARGTVVLGMPGHHGSSMPGAGREREEALGLEGQAALASVLSRLGTRHFALRIGRYEIGDVLGRGGCGQVYAARDPELDREVALKVVFAGREQPDAAAEKRLHREAQALARLDNPHVVPVFDVGIDAIGTGTGAPARRGVYIVMARLRGITLWRWLRDAKPTHTQIIDAFLQAARGLAAAHAVGVVHRDFKPGNAMLTDGGIVVVIDFGLARALDEAVGSGGATTDRAHPPRSNDSGGSLTATGSVMGTPRYMAPEQHAASPATAATDQYAWCVALWEALTGEPPFRAASLAELSDAKRARGLPPAPMISRTLRAVLVRGMRPKPQDRWPSMHALCDAIARGPARRRRIVGLASIAAIALMGLGAWGKASIDAQRRHARCVEDTAIAGIWNETRAEQIGEAFAATGIAYASETWDRSRARLDDYTESWSALAERACQASAQEGDAHPERVRARVACLSERRGALQALLDQLQAADATVVLKAAFATAALPPLDACDDEEQLKRWIDLPPDPETQRSVLDLRARLFAAAAARTTGRHEDALAEANAVLRDALALGWTPLVIEARLAVSDAQQLLGRHEDGRRTAEQAFFEAQATGHDELALRASTALVFIIGHDLARYDEALQWGRLAQAQVQRRGLPDDAVVAQLLASLGAVHTARGDADASLSLHERALALRKQTLGPAHPDVAASHNGLGAAHRTQGKDDAALEHFEKALAIYETALGSAHPRVAMILNNIGIVQQARGNDADAIVRHERARGIFENAHGPDHPLVAVTHNSLGNAALTQKRYDEATQHFSRALTIWENALGPDHPNVAKALGSLGHVHVTRGQPDEALPLFRRALAIREKTLPTDHPDIASSFNDLGITYHGREDYPAALIEYARALAMWEKTLGPDHPHVAKALMNLGDVHYARGDHAQAIAHYERVLEIRARGSATDSDLASVRFALARARWDVGADRPAAVALAEAAADVYRTLRPEHAEALAGVEAWLSTHR